MRDFFLVASEYSAIFITYMALIVIVYGAAEMAWAALSVIPRRPTDQAFVTDRFVRFGRWLVIGLTFHLAADVIETATATTADGWQDVGRLAAIAVIRTFLSYFLERDIKEVSEANLAAHERQERA